MPREVILDWKGPFCIGASEAADALPPPALSGVYIWVVPTIHGRLIAYVGVSADIRHRWSVHVMWHLGGQYQLFDTEALRAGELRRVYGAIDDATNLTEFISGGFHRVAIENLLSYELYWAAAPRELLRPIESSLIFALQGAPHGRLLQNRSVSVSGVNSVCIRCSSRAPAGIVLCGMTDPIVYGVVECHEIA